MELESWLKRMRFTAHPFDRPLGAEGEPGLTAYFAKPASYSRIKAQFTPPRSGVIHGERGAGKSALCRMFPDLHFGLGAGDQTGLVAHVSNWRPIVIARDRPDFAAGAPHCDAILAEVLNLLADRYVATEPTAVSSPTRTTLVWLCERVIAGSSEEASAGLAAFRDSLAAKARRPREVGDVQDIAGVLAALARCLKSLGYTHGWVLLDRIDDYLDAGPNWADEAAELLTPLLGKVPIHQLDGLILTYFVPSEALERLERQGRMSHKLSRERLSWDTLSLGELLRQRLLYFSDRQVSSLNVLIGPDMKAIDLDLVLIEASAGIPRTLLELCHELFDRAAATATDEHRQIDTACYEQFLADRLRPKPPGPVEIAPAGKPLTPAETRQLGELIWTRLSANPDPRDALGALTFNLDSNVRRITLSPHQTPIEQLMALIEQFNSYIWRTLEHPLITLLENFKLFYKGTLSKEELELHAQWVNRVIRYLGGT